MNQASAQAAFSLSPSLSGTFTWSGMTMTFTPNGPLASATAYTATIATSATDAHGVALASPYSWSFTTAAAAGPAAPTGLAAADHPADQGGALDLSWTPSVSTNVTQQRLYRSTTTGGPYALVTTIANNTTATYTDSGLTTNTLYYYVLRAYDGTSESANSNQASATPLDNTSTNLALGKPVTASSIYGAGFEATRAVDGNLTTRWSSQFSDPQWLMVDLGATYAISSMKLTWETAYAKAYRIDVSSDAATWTTIYSTTTGAGGIEQLTGLVGTGRYVRMYGTVRGTIYGYSLWEMEVYGSSP